MRGTKTFFVWNMDAKYLSLIDRVTKIFSYLMVYRKKQFAAYFNYAATINIAIFTLVRAQTDKPNS